jgi:ferredoxin
MAFMIDPSLCTACGACEFECPNNAISMAGHIYAIDPAKCQECNGVYDTQQCAKVCPVPDTCIPAREAG